MTAYLQVGTPQGQDCELYRQILGIQAPWLVGRVELKLAEGEVHVYLEHGEMASWPCPECGTNCQLYDHLLALEEATRATDLGQDRVEHLQGRGHTRRYQ